MNEKNINLFIERLGLTEYESKTLTALFTLREAEAPEISRHAQVPKTRVYDVLDKLTKNNLIIEIAGRPKKYRSVEPDRVFAKLIEEKRKELGLLEEKSKEITELLSVAEIDSSINEKVMKVKEKQDFFKILSQELEKANDSVNAFTNHSKDYYSLKESIKANPNKLNVKILGKNSVENAKNALEITSLGGKIKEAEHGMHAYVIDDKKVIMALSDFNLDKPEYHFTIWPENKPLANTLNHYFDKFWG
ncbi:MAG: TrmB family transcriptional regulator [Candidatus Diapherotrites archaeon]|nr:TrmB family transcriptional regulator [Candidatus Diapherotrites archaeon]